MFTHSWYIFLMQKLLNAQDLSFVGYTFKNFDAVKGLHQPTGKQSYCEKIAGDSNVPV